MPRRKKEFISENVTSQQPELGNMSIMNGYIVIKAESINSNEAFRGEGEVVGLGSINPLQLSLGERVFFDQVKSAPLGGGLYALKFDDVIARANLNETKKLLLEEQKDEQIIEESQEVDEPQIQEQPQAKTVAPTPSQFQVPAVNPPCYNITKSFQPKGGKPIPPSGAKHVDKPIRK